MNSRHSVRGISEIAGVCVTVENSCQRPIVAVANVGGDGGDEDNDHDGQLSRGAKAPGPRID